MPPKANPNEPSYPHMHVKLLMPDGGYANITQELGTPVPRWAEGIHIMGNDFMVTHVCWSYEPEDGPHLPLCRVYLCDADDWDEDNWPMPPGHDGAKHPSVGDIDVGPDIQP